MKWSQLFEKINKIDKPLSRLMKKKEDSDNIVTERGDITNDVREITRIIRHNYDQLYMDKLAYLEKWISFWKIQPTKKKSRRNII